jgi:hypothetical protein
MRTPRISMIAMDARDPKKAFVRVPDEPGRWIYADRCVVEVPCSQCEAAIGEPCKGRYSGKYWVDTHYRRRNAWAALRKQVDHIRIHEEDVKPRIQMYADMRAVQ